MSLQLSPGRAVSEMYPSLCRERSTGKVSPCPPCSIGQWGPYVACATETIVTGRRSATQNYGEESEKARGGLQRPKSRAFILYSIYLFASEKDTEVGNYDWVFVILLMAGFVVARGTWPNQGKNQPSVVLSGLICCLEIVGSFSIGLTSPSCSASISMTTLLTWAYHLILGRKPNPWPRRDVPERG